MKFNKNRFLAATLSTTMVVSMFPAQEVLEVHAENEAADARVIANFNFDDETSGFAGGGAVAKNQGITLSEDAVSGKAAYFNGKSFLEVLSEDGSSLLTDRSQLTVSYLRKLEDGGIGWSFFAAPNADTQSYPNEHYVGVLDKNNSVLVERYNNEGHRGQSLTVRGDYKGWEMVTIVLDETATNVYVNGELQGTLDNEYKLIDILGTDSILYIGKANWGSGEYFKGLIDDFSIYDTVLTEDEIARMYEEEEAKLLSKQFADTVKKMSESLEAVILNGNKSKDFVSKKLYFPEELEGISFSYSISDETLVADDGRILYTGADSKEVTISVTGTYDGKEVIKKEFTFAIVNPLMADFEALSLVHMDSVKGNLTLPKVGENGSKITWTSSNPSVISDKEVENAGYDATPAGVVNRQKEDTKVTLTATISNGEESVTKEFKVTVKAKAEEKETTDYLFAYFTANTVQGENIYFATSRDGLNWTEVNDKDPVLTSELGEKGLRDPFIMRSKEGDRFYMIATDLSIGRNGDWGRAQNGGSQAIMVWESEDLVHWSEQRMIPLTEELEAGCTWAPEAYYDDVTGEYVVFWASKVKADNYGLHRIYYSKTRDFYTFTKPQVWIDRKTAQTIDTTIVKGNDGYLYRISKNEGNATLEDGTTVTGATVYMEKGKTLLGEWTKVYAPTLESIAGVEGPTCFQLNSDDVKEDSWCLLLDHYGSGGYRPYITTDLTQNATEAVFKKPTEYALPSAPRHGTVLQVTTEEYKALMKAYGQVEEEENIERNLEENIVAAYSFGEKTLKDTVSGTVISDESQNGFDAVITGNNASIKDGALYLPGGAAGSKAAYVSLPGELFANKDTMTISVWLKNDTGAGNYAAMSFGTKTNVMGGGVATAPLHYWILNPAAPGGYFKSVWTNGENAGSPWTTETATSGFVTGSDWAMYTTVITPTSIKGYYNGKLVTSEKKTVTTTDFGEELVAAIGRSGYNDMFYRGGVSDVLVFDVALTANEINAEYAKVSLEKAKTSLMLEGIEEVKTDLVLPTEGLFGTSISWSSSDEEIVAADGKVTRPSKDEVYEVTLTATITLGEESVTKDFTVKVLGASAKTLFAEAMEDFSLGVTKLDRNIELPTEIALLGTKVSWSSDNEAILSKEGIVNRPESGKEDATVVLTATVSFETEGEVITATKDFTVVVRALDYGYLLAYTNAKESEALGNSLHLAVSTDGKTFSALNSNTGICFANNAGGSKSVNPNSLGDLKLVRKANGTYSLLAKNQTTKSQYLYVFDSLDLIHFDGEKKLAVGSVVSEVVGCTYDETAKCYSVYWKSGETLFATQTQDFETVIGTKEVEEAILDQVTIAEDAVFPEGAVVGNVLPVNLSEFTYVNNKIGTVKNTGIRPVEISATTAAEVSLPEKVTAEYSDGSSADMKVDWDLSGVDFSKKGTYEVTGKIKQKVYANPLIPQRADPCILKGEDGYYYFTASYPMCGGGDKDGYDKVVLRRAETIEGLADAEEITIWDCDDFAGENRYVWAPEIHCIEGNYYVFYTSSVESRNVWGIRPHVLKCNNAAEIMNPASWEPMGVMQAVEEDAVSFSNFSLDMTLFENKGRYYVMWAQTDGYSSIFIAEVDKNEPWKCISKATKISVPEFGWERVMENVNEGPSIIKGDGKLFCTFSAAGTGVEYCLGLLTADMDADLLKKESWVKQSYPVLTSSDVKGEYGPGHNSFTVDEDGNDIFVYHARGQECYDRKCDWAADGSLYDPCRDARVKRVHWAADGTPILRMTYEDELITDTVTAKIVITVGMTATLTYEASEGGLIEGETLQIVSIGENGTPVKAVAKNGYRFVQWSDGVKEAERTDLNVTENKTVTATFEKVKPVTPEIPVVGVILNPVLTTRVPGETFSVGATILPVRATNKTLTWSSSNPKVATVDENGNVKTLASGTATIMARAKNGAVGICIVNVCSAPTFVTMNHIIQAARVGQKVSLKATVYPAKANSKLLWTSTNPYVATVDQNGVVTAKRRGLATICVRTSNGKTASCEIIVY